MKKYEAYSMQVFINRIAELEEIICSLQDRELNEELLNVPWASNLGLWYWFINNDHLVFDSSKVLDLGYSMEEISETIGYRFFTEKIHQEDYHKVIKNMIRHLKSYQPLFEAEFRIKTKEGYYKWFYARGKVTKTDDKGNPVLLTVRIFDISEKKETEMLLVEKNKELEELSYTDELTKTLNRRAFVEKLQNEIFRIERTGMCFSLIIMDVDNFKKINDNFGHPAGDELLKGLVEFLKQRIRKTDSLVRWGGDEFVILLPDTDAENAICLAEEILQNISCVKISDLDPVTVSIGVTGYCADDTVDSLIKRADDLMYEAKSANKNCLRYMGKCEAI